MAGRSPSTAPLTRTDAGSSSASTICCSTSTWPAPPATASRPPTGRIGLWVERTVAGLSRRNRRVPCPGVAKNSALLRNRVAGITLPRLLALGLTYRAGAWHLARPAVVGASRNRPSSPARSTRASRKALTRAPTPEPVNRGVPSRHPAGCVTPTTATKKPRNPSLFSGIASVLCGVTLWYVREDRTPASRRQGARDVPPLRWYPSSPPSASVRRCRRLRARRGFGAGRSGVCRAGEPGQPRPVGVGICQPDAVTDGGHAPCR